MNVRSVPTRDDVARRLGQALLDALALTIGEAAPAPPAPVVSEGTALLTRDQVADRLGCGLTSVKSLLRGELAAHVVHLGRSVRIPSDAVDAYIARLRADERGRLPGDTPVRLDSRRSGPRSQRAASSAARTARRSAPKRTTRER